MIILETILISFSFMESLTTIITLLAVLTVTCHDWEYMDVTKIYMKSNCINIFFMEI